MAMQTMRQIMTDVIKRVGHGALLEETVKEIFAFDAVQEFIEQHQEEVSQEMITNSISKLNEFMLEVKAMRSGKPGQNPGFTPKLFININYIDITYVPTQEFLDYTEKRKRRALLDNRMMSADVRRARLSDFDMAGSPARQTLMTEVIKFIEEYQENPLAAKGLYISGPFGVGKTFLLGALANELVRKNVAVTMLHYPTFSAEIKNTISQNTTHETLNTIKKVPVLMLDDIGAEANSAWLRDEVLTVILEYRMKESLATFFTSNFNLRELESHLAQTRDGVEAVKAGRIMERVHFLAKEIHFDGANRRHKA